MQWLLMCPLAEYVAASLHFLLLWCLSVCGVYAVRSDNPQVLPSRVLNRNAEEVSSVEDTAGFLSLQMPGATKLHHELQYDAAYLSRGKHRACLHWPPLSVHFTSSPSALLLQWLRMTGTHLISGGLVK